MDKSNGKTAADHSAAANGSASAIKPSQLKQFEKNLAAAAELGQQLSVLGRNILQAVRSATDAISSHRQTELPLTSRPTREKSTKRTPGRDS